MSEEDASKSEWSLNTSCRDCCGGKGILDKHCFDTAVKLSLRRLSFRFEWDFYFSGVKEYKRMVTLNIRSFTLGFYCYGT